METKNNAERDPEEVFDDHLKLANNGELEEDLVRNYTEDIVLLTSYGDFYGHDGVREAAKLLQKQLPGGKYNYVLKRCHENVCFLQWTGDSKKSFIEDGADSFLIENGKIKIQTIYYTVTER
jgi:hypothetical protein